MSRPAPKQRNSVLDYNECADYISKKLGYDLRDVAGRWAGHRADYSKPYLDYWHFLCDRFEPVNGGSITIGQSLLGEPEWRDAITKAFIDEFGDGAEYVCEW